MARSTGTTTPRKPGARVPAGTGAAGAAKGATSRLSKEELRAEVEKLARANARLRSKGREAGRAGKEAAARIAELEGEVARLQRQLKRQEPKRAVPASAGGKRPAARERRRREIDPGDAVPPGVAVAEPEPLDQEAEAARAALEDHLPGGEGEP